MTEPKNQQPNNETPPVATGPRNLDEAPHKPSPGGRIVINIGDSDNDGRADLQIDVDVEGITVFHTKALNVPDIPHALLNVLPAAAHAMGIALGAKLSPMNIFQMIRGL
jgi:hypothetical protein